ncbi:MAG: hypothetical protein ACHQ4H_09300 [Ktedonobacterales bacterium]
MEDAIPDLVIEWSPVYRPEWDATPDAYAAHDVVRWGYSRRLARAEDAARRFTAYLGVRHFDPGRYGLAGDPQTKFFVSLFVNRRTVALRTFPTMAQAREMLARFHAQLPLSGSAPP